MSITDEIKESFRKGTTLDKLIYLNLGLFLTVQIVRIILFLANSYGLFDDFLNTLAIPANLEVLAKRPWTISFIFCSISYGCIGLVLFSSRNWD